MALGVCAALTLYLLEGTAFGRATQWATKANLIDNQLGLG